MNAPDESEKTRRWSAFISRPGSAGTNDSAAVPSSQDSVSSRPSSSGGLGNNWRSWDKFSAMATPISSAISGRSGVAMSRSTTLDSAPFSSRAKPPRRNNSLLLISSFKRQDSDQQTLDIHESRLPEPIKSPDSARSSFGKAFLGLSSLSLSRTSTRDSNDDKDRGRSLFRLKQGKSSSSTPAEQDVEAPSRSLSRSHSPFSFPRFGRYRDLSPQPIPLSHSDADLSDAASTVHPRSTAFSDDDSGDETNVIDGEIDEDSSTDDCDPITERNTERNAVIPPPMDNCLGPEIEDPDPVGEGVNIVVAPEPYFPSTLNSTPSTTGKRNPRKRKTLDPPPFHTSRPVFQKDRCTITITQGDPEGKLGGRKKRQYVVASDLSEESRYAVEWGIGTVLRDGDEMWLVTVIENESKSMFSLLYSLNP